MKRALAGALGLVGIAALVWVLWPSMPSPRHLPAPRSEALPARPAEAAEPVAAARPVVAAKASMAGSTVAAGTRVWDLCGVGRMPMPVGRGSSTLPGHLGEDLYRASRAQWIETLRHGGGRARAAAVLLTGVERGGGDDTTGSAVPTGEGEWAAVRQRAADAQARVALETRDPVALHWALGRCRPERCDPRLLQAWLEIEPDNAVPWLLWSYGRPERQARALEAVLGAKRFDSHHGQLAAALVAAMPRDAQAYLQPAMLVEATGVEAALGDTSLSTLFQWCRPAPAAGSQRQADCSALAQLLVERGDSLLLRGTGRQIGEYAAWPRERVEALKQENAGLLKVLQAGVPFESAQPLSCASVEALRDWFALQGRLGEVGALRAMAAASAPR